MTSTLAHLGEPVTQPEPPDRIATHLRLEVALDQLLNPEVRTLDRDPADIARQLADEQRAYLGLIGYLADRIRDAAQRGDVDTTERARCGIDQAADRHRGRRAAITATRALLPSLLEQLFAAIENSNNTGAGGDSRPASHRSPVGLAALALVADIQARSGQPAETELVNHLRVWAAGDRTDDDATNAEHWVEQARAVLNPSRRRTLVGRCLNCGRGYVHLPDDAGEIVRRPALEVDTDASCRCLGCGYRWPPERAHLLAEALDVQREEDRRERTTRHTEQRPR